MLKFSHINRDWLPSTYFKLDLKLQLRRQNTSNNFFFEKILSVIVRVICFSELKAGKKDLPNFLINLINLSQYVFLRAKSHLSKKSQVLRKELKFFQFVSY